MNQEWIAVTDRKQCGGEFLKTVQTLAGQGLKTIILREKIFGRRVRGTGSPVYGNMQENRGFADSPQVLSCGPRPGSRQDPSAVPCISGECR